MNDTKTASLEPGNRIQLPAEWAEELGLRDVVVLNKTGAGILVCLGQPLGWDAVFTSKLCIGPPTPASNDIEVATDDLLF